MFLWLFPRLTPKDAFKHNGIIANPNCTTIIMLVALKQVLKR